MGGDREDVIQDDKAEDGGEVHIQEPPPEEEEDEDDEEEEVDPATARAIRFHQSDGEVHFHDDKLKLKAAVPVAEWHVAMRLLHRLEKWSYLDVKNGTLIKMRPYITEENDLTMVEVFVEIGKIGLGHTLKALAKFTRR